MRALTLSPSLRELVVELLGLHRADGRVERRHDADDRRLAFEVGERDRLHAAFEVVDLEIGGGLPGFYFVAGERERSAFERDGSGA